MYQEIILDQKVIARFWSKVQKGWNDDCWNWTGSTRGSGAVYGVLKIGRKCIAASRISYFIANGHIDNYLEMLHTCPNGDNTLCVNPRHLRQGTHIDNMRDMRERGRSLVGEKHRCATLTEEDVLIIRQLIGILKVSELAKHFGVNYGVVSQIKHGRTWKHLIPEEVSAQ